MKFSDNNNNNSNQSNLEEIDDFTLLIYIIGSDLEDKTYEASKDINEMNKSHINNPKVNVVLEIGGSKGKPDTNRTIDFSMVKRYQLENNKLKNLTNLGGNISMGKEETLSDFINWGISNFSAKKYGLILWDHGGSYGGFGRDINHNNDGLTLYELTNALHFSKMNNSLNSVSKNINFEFIGFDSCLMASLEVANSIYIEYNTDSKMNAKFLIASEEIEPNWGWNYTHLLNTLKINPNISGQLLGENIALSYANDSKKISSEKQFFADRDITLSVIDLKNIPSFTTKFENLWNNVVKNIANFDLASKILPAVDLTEHFGKTTTESFGIVDLYHLLSSIKSVFPNATLQINEIKNMFPSVVVYNYTGESHPNANGISFFVPITKQEYEQSQDVRYLSTQSITQDITKFSRLYKNDMNTHNPIRTPQL